MPPLRLQNRRFCAEKTRFRAAANTKNDTLRLRCGRSSARTLRSVSVFETALLGRPAEKSGLSIDCSPPHGESQAPLEIHKWPFMPPNGVISAEQCYRERYLMTAWRRMQSDANSSPPQFPANREKYRESNRFAYDALRLMLHYGGVYNET